MVEQKQELTALEKLFKKYGFATIPNAMLERPGWTPHVGLTVHGSTWVSLIYYPKDSVQCKEKLTGSGLAKLIVAEFRRCGVAIRY